LPDTFCLVFDGWTFGGQNVHYVAVFATFFLEGELHEVLLTIAPLFNESDLGAESHKDFIVGTLKYYNKTLENVVCIIGDNMSTNVALAKISGVPLVGCASHRLNLEVSQYLKPWEGLLDRVHLLMVKLRNLKLSGSLRKYTQLKPKLRCTTRWSGTFEMVHRYFELKDFLPALAEECADLYELMLGVGEENKLTKLMENLNSIWSVTLKLQERGMTTEKTRILFDGLMSKFPEMGSHISKDSAIVHFKDFENGVVKIALGRSQTLTEDESKAVEKLKIKEIEPTKNPSEISFADTLLSSGLDYYKCTKETYMNTNFILAGSTMVESLFSVCDYMFDDRRTNSTPEHFEVQVFLKANRKYWGLSDVNKVVTLNDKTDQPKTNVFLRNNSNVDKETNKDTLVGETLGNKQSSYTQHVLNDLFENSFGFTQEGNKRARIENSKV